MGRKQGPRKGSLQFWPRKRAEKILPRVNWKAVIAKKLEKADKDSKTNFLGFIGYKAGMASAFVKDNTPDSMTKSKRIIVPVTVIECPSMKIFSVRLYKNGKVVREVLNEGLDKELIRVVRMPGKESKNKKANAKETIEKLEKENKEEVEDIKVIAYSEAKKTAIKKTPDLSELGLTGSLQEKIAFVKEHLSKEISITEVFSKGVVDIRGLTTGRGFQGTVKRFGVRLRFHKSEKGVRRVGSIGAWHPTGVKFRVPMPGQMGYQTRITYNLPIIASKKISEQDTITKEISKRMFSNFGDLRTDYLILAGSIQGPAKRQVLITSSLRPTKKQVKRNYELLEIR